jgi:hypothetical protein
VKISIVWEHDKFSVEVGHQFGSGNVLLLSKAIVAALEDVQKAVSKTTTNNSKPTPKCGVTVVNLGEITDNETLNHILENLPPEILELVKRGRNQ